MAVHPRVVCRRRSTITDLPLYYSGHLLKKSSKEKDFKKYYGELRGATLFLYKDDTQDTYTEKTDLEQLKAMELESPFEKKAPTIFTLTLHTGEVQLMVENPDRGEEWRGYLLTVIKKEIPSKLQLLPGQMLQLREVLSQERKRNPPTVVRPPLPPRPTFLQPAPRRPSSPPPGPPPSPPPEDQSGHNTSDMPACFFNVTRQEAEQMLEANPEYGSIILRPSTLAHNYALTLRQQTTSGPIMKNYRVTATNSGFIIELEIGVTVSSLNDVVKYVLEKTEYRLHPYVVSQPYDTCLDASPAPKCTSVTSSKTKTVPRARVAPMRHSKPKEEPPPLPSEPPEGDYIYPDVHYPDDHGQKPDTGFKGELLEVLKCRRESIYAATVEEESNVYQNQKSKTLGTGKAQWSKH